MAELVCDEAKRSRPDSPKRISRSYSFRKFSKATNETIPSNSASSRQ